MNVKEIISEIVIFRRTHIKKLKLKIKKTTIILETFTEYTFYYHT